MRIERTTPSGNKYLSGHQNPSRATIQAEDAQIDAQAREEEEQEAAIPAAKKRHPWKGRP